MLFLEAHFARYPCRKLNRTRGSLARFLGPFSKRSMAGPPTFHFTVVRSLEVLTREGKPGNAGCRKLSKVTSSQEDDVDIRTLVA